MRRHQETPAQATLEAARRQYHAALMWYAAGGSQEARQRVGQTFSLLQAAFARLLDERRPT